MPENRALLNASDPNAAKTFNLEAGEALDIKYGIGSLLSLIIIFSQTPHFKTIFALLLL
jgi:hypothetical protein